MCMYASCMQHPTCMPLSSQVAKFCMASSVVIPETGAWIVGATLASESKLHRTLDTQKLHAWARSVMVPEARTTDKSRSPARSEKGRPRSAGTDGEHLVLPPIKCTSPEPQKAALHEQDSNSTSATGAKGNAQAAPGASQLPELQ